MIKSLGTFYGRYHGKQARAGADIQHAHRILFPFPPLPPTNGFDDGVGEFRVASYVVQHPEVPSRDESADERVEAIDGGV